LVDTGLVYQVAHSGRTVWRSATMSEMLAEAKAGAFDLLLAGYSDRWQRNLRRDAKENLERTSADGFRPSVPWRGSGRCRRRGGRLKFPRRKADLLHAIYDRIVVAGRRIVSARLTPSAYTDGFALALPEKVAVARPTGLEPATFGSGTQRSIH
jgi:hypothetical protein